MANSSNKKLNKQLEDAAYKELLVEFKKVNSPERLVIFFNAFMTNSEKDLVVRRIAVMQLMAQNKKYKEIKKMLNVSDNTISNARDILDGRGYGRNPDRKRKYSPFTIGKIRKRKPILPKYKGARSII